MNRALVVTLLTVSLGTACRQKPAEGPVAGATTPAAGTPAAAAPASAGQTGQPADGRPAEAVKPVPAELPGVIARVNGEAIERWELESALKQAEASAGSDVPPEERDGVLRNILDTLVNYHMLAQEARARKVAVSEADLDARIKMIREGFPTDAAFDQAVKDRGLTRDRLRQQERRNLQARKLIDAEVTSRISVADADVDAFYKQNIEKFKQGETFHSSHIFIATASDADPATKQTARAKAQDLLRQLKAGADFATLAREHSDDTTAEKGGDMGFMGQGELPPDYERILFSLKPGELSDVVELGAGFHIIKFHERRAPRTVPFEEVKGDLKEYLTDSQRQAKLQAFLDAVRAKTKIDILV